MAYSATTTAVMSAEAGTRLAEEMCFGKEYRWVKSVRNRSDADRDAAKLSARAESDCVLCRTS